MLILRLLQNKHVSTRYIITNLLWYFLIIIKFLIIINPGNNFHWNLHRVVQKKKIKDNGFFCCQ